MAKTKKGKQELVAAAPEQEDLGVAEPEDIELLEEPEPEEVEPEPETQPGVEAEAEPEVVATTEELYQRATELKIRGRRKMNRTELVEAIQQAELEGNVPAVDDPIGDGSSEGTESDAPKQQATPQQVLAVNKATDSQLENALNDPKFPGFMRELAVAELGRRAAARDQKTSLAARQGPMERYKVTKGGRYVSKEGFPTHLPEGALVTPLTHDLKDVAKQGIEFEPCSVVGVRLDEMGRQISEIH